MSTSTPVRLYLVVIIVIIGALLSQMPRQAAAQCAEPLFDEPIRIATEAEARAMAAADLDGDNQADLVLAGAGRDSLSVFLSRHVASGELAAPVHSLVGADPSGLTIADVNGDGARDVLVALSGEDKIVVLLNDGNGTLTSSATLAVGAQPTSLAVADLNGDGRLDLAVANTASSDVSVLLGNDVGGWESGRRFPVGRSPHSLIIGDWQGDGILDIAVVASDINMISTLKGDGTGSFGDVVNFPVLVLPIAMVAHDLDGDGRIELVVANQGSDNVTVAAPNADGALETRNYPAWLGPADLGVGDFNRDKLPDIAVTNRDGVSLSILQAKKDGGFSDPHKIPLKSAPGALIVADFNGDGRADVALATAREVMILVNGCGPGPLPSLSLLVAIGTAAYLLIALFLARRYPHVPSAH